MGPVVTLSVASMAMRIRKIHSQIECESFAASCVIFVKAAPRRGHECVKNKFIILIGWARGEIKIRTDNELCWQQVKEKACGKKERKEKKTTEVDNITP